MTASQIIARCIAAMTAALTVFFAIKHYELTMAEQRCTDRGGIALRINLQSVFC